MPNMMDCFDVKKPFIGVIHASGQGDQEILELAKKEIETYVDNGINGILVETYFGQYHNVQDILGYLQQAKLPVPYGINCLNVDVMGFELANQFDCDFIQMDSVVGHVKPRDEETIGAFFDLYRPKCKAALMGGVRFKYQPVLSEKSLEEDLATGMKRCDCICVTGEGTGIETDLGKIKEFRSIIGDFPMFVCAGVTPTNVLAQLPYVDGAVVGSYFKDNHKDTGIVYGPHVREIMELVEKYREENA